MDQIQKTVIKPFVKAAQKTAFSFKVERSKLKALTETTHLYKPLRECLEFISENVEVKPKTSKVYEEKNDFVEKE